ncbi:Hypothetical predicted protein [Cloeon dipterum]|uniref:Major facilitator superfamily (MFS) profile domain-containing protein n=1 Tax=Cloeon dipterum TaxID=197152 RepID=A0A8S1D8K9_9INSE|nr:Hypothetical predicted protein [Cloeon dipterum]
MIRIQFFPKSFRLVLLCSVANFINAADRVIMPIAIIQMTDEFNWSLHTQGWILSAFSVGYLTSQLAGAFMFGGYGGKTLLIFSVLLWSFSTILTPLVASSSIAGLVFFRIVLGIGEGLGLPTMYHLLAVSVPEEERSRAFGYLVAAGSVGQTFASVLCPHLYWPTSFYIFGLMGFAWVVLWMCSMANLQTNLHIPLFRDQQKQQTYSGWALLSHWALWSIYLAHFAMNWTSYIVMQWLPTYLLRSLGAGKENISFTAVPYIFNSILAIVAGHFADKLVSKGWSLLKVRRLMTNIGLVGPAFFLMAFCAVNNLAAAVVLVSISMGLCAFNSAGHLSNHADVAPEHAGATFALSNTLATIPGILCGPLTAELVTASRGRWLPVYVLAAVINFTSAIIYQSQSFASPVL